MKLLVAFENTPESKQNLRAALRTARLLQTDNPELKPDLQVRVCVLALLREDKPLDEYLGEMERDRRAALEAARQIIAEENMPSAIIEVVQGMEPESAHLIARRANEWGADQLFVSQSQECSECYKARLAATRGKRKIWFLGLKRSRLYPQLEGDKVQPGIKEFNQKIRADELLNLSGCRIVLTCHGVVTMAVQKYLPKAGRHCERIVYERV
jgi:nucleotide-binding universal stress UspA family protein